MADRHTPGPWIFKGPSPGLASNPCDDGGDYGIMANLFDLETKLFCIAEVINKVDYGMYAPAKDNARLIAAAPDLLEACKVAISWLAPSPDAEYLVDYPEMVRMIETAIAKAENEATKGNI